MLLRRYLVCGLVAVLAAFGLTGCGRDDRAGDDASTMAADVDLACSSIRTLHNEIAAIANEMALAEVDADPAQRAIIVADALDAMIDVAEMTRLPERPAELVEDLESRRDVAVAGVRIEAAEFRERWNRIDADQRSSAVTAVFVLGEKLFSETEPRVATTASPELVLAVEAEEACRHVVQMP